jgi:hypothetical protein
MSILNIPKDPFDKQDMDGKSTSAKHWMLWGICLCVYMFYVFGHAPLTDLLMYLSKKYTEQVYAHYVLMIGWILLGIFLLLLAGVFHLADRRIAKLAAWLVFCAFIYFNYNRMISYSIEYVHFVQYMILAGILFYATRRNYVATAVICLVAGLLDELYQTGLAEPLNWRDYGLNTVGTVGGLLLIWTIQGSRLVGRQEKK